MPQLSQFPPTNALDLDSILRKKITKEIEKKSIGTFETKVYSDHLMMLSFGI